MRHTYLFICFLSLLVLSGCLKIITNVPQGSTTMPSIEHDFSAGAARVDITPPLGQPQAGFGSDIGQLSRGWWTKVWATSNFIQDKNGRFLFITNCDLWAFPIGLGDYVLEKLHAFDIEELKIAREQILFTATHTHNAPGNYSSSIGYNLGSSTKEGFDRKLFKFMGDRIALSIKRAYENRRPCHIRYALGHVEGVSRNRSVMPFLENRTELIDKFFDRIENGQQYTQNEPPCLADDSLQYKALDPTLTCILFSDLNTGIPFSIINNFGVHPTCMGAPTQVYSSDIFGVANNIVRSYYQENKQADKIISTILNGAEGDISPNWTHHGHKETIEFGSKLAAHIIETLESSLTPIHGNIVTRMDFKSISDQKVFPYDDPAKCSDGEIIDRTAKNPQIGESLVFGSEDGRVPRKPIIDECLPNGESKALEECFETQGNKYIHDLGRVIVFTKPPKLAPVAVHSVGPLHFITMPGEVTVGLAERLMQRIPNNDDEHIMLIGLSNEYLSYLTTPEEYALQHYEGGSTIFGPASGIFFENEVERVFSSMAYENNYYNKKKYRVGPPLKTFKILKEIRKK